MVYSTPLLGRLVPTGPVPGYDLFTWTRLYFIHMSIQHDENRTLPSQPPLLSRYLYRRVSVGVGVVRRPHLSLPFVASLGSSSILLVVEEKIMVTDRRRS